MKLTRRALIRDGLSLAAFSAIYGYSITRANATAQSLRNVYDFESGTLGSLRTSGNVPTATNDFARNGRWAMRSVLDRNNSPKPYRTEAVVPGTQVIGEEYWVGISIRTSADWVPSRSGEILFQMHDTPANWSNARNPILALSIDSTYKTGGWRLANRWLPIYDGTKADQRTAFSKELGPVLPGEWVDWVFNWRWDWRESGAGFTRAWKQGKLVVDYAGPNCYNDDVGPYVKFGIYKWDWKDATFVDNVSSRVIFHDEYREAGRDGSYALVAPGSSSAMPRSPTSVVVR